MIVFHEEIMESIKERESGRKWRRGIPLLKGKFCTRGTIDLKHRLFGVLFYLNKIILILPHYPFHHGRDTKTFFWIYRHVVFIGWL